MRWICPTNPHGVPDSQSNDGANDNANNANARLRLQRVLNKILSNKDKEELKAKLFSIGYKGHLMVAQLNSQSARSAMAWLGLKGLSLPNLQMALITVTAVVQVQYECTATSVHGASLTLQYPTSLI